MHTKKITQNFTLIRQNFQRYFSFKREEAYPDLLMLLVLGICALCGLLGYIYKIDLLLFMGLFSFLTTFFWISYQRIKYKFACLKFLNRLEETVTPGEIFTFKFDADHIVYEFESETLQFKWASIKFCQENGGDLYLYRKNGELLDIFSDTIMGEEMMREFKAIVYEKTKGILVAGEVLMSE